MSESNKPELELITTNTEAELLSAESFDFEFIASTLNLIPIQGGKAAISLTAITDIELDEDGNWAVGLQNDSEYTLSDEEMAEFEKALRQRIEDSKAKQKEAIKENLRMQAEAVNELQGGVQQATGVIVDGRGQKRGRFH